MSMGDHTTNQLVLQDTNAAGIYPNNYVGDLWNPWPYRGPSYVAPVVYSYPWPQSYCHGHCWCVEMTPPRSKKLHEECCKCSDRRLSEEV